MFVFLKSHWRKFVIGLVSLPFVGFLVICFFIGVGVRGALSDAQSRFPGDPVAALISVATSEEAPLKDRDRAIWALGQLGASEALPPLHTLVSDGGCDHDSKICQYELEKAIEACSGGPNIGAVIWRHGDLAVAGKD